MKDSPEMFPLAVVLSVTTGTNLVPTHELTKLIAHMVGTEESNISGMAVMAYIDECRNAILVQRPYLESAKIPPAIERQTWLKEQIKLFGERINLASISAVRSREA